MTDQDQEILLGALLSQGSDTASVRLDQVEGSGIAAAGPRAWLSLAARLSEALELAGDTRTMVMAIPISVTEQICLAAPVDMEFVSDPADAPTLYLYPGDDFLIEADEEYRKVVPTGTQLSAVYRSWRDAMGAEHGWEFNNFLFIWRPARSGRS